MQALLKLFVNICLIRQGPQDIPYSQALFKWVIVAYAIVAYLVLLPQHNFVYVCFEVMVEVFLTLGFVWGMLVYTQKQARFVQVACGFLGTDALLSFSALPLLLMAQNPQPGPGIFMLLFGIMLWHWFVCGHIIRHALNKPLFMGLGISFLYSVSFYQIMELLFPANNL